MSGGRHLKASTPQCGGARRSWPTRLAVGLGLLAFGLATAVESPWVTSAGAGQSAAATAAASTQVTKSVTATRTHLLNGVDVPVESRDVTVTVSTTQNLRDRQSIQLSWTGAHPTGGRVADTNSLLAAHQEYPFMIVECRGVDSTTAPADQQLSPATCWTQTPGERVGADFTFVFPPFRVDRYATPDQRKYWVGVPSDAQKLCGNAVAGAQHWIPFVAADGTNYPGGPNGCAGIPPEAANFDASQAPGSTTYAVTDTSGNGESRFIVQTGESNASLGCSSTVPCSLVAIPIIGVSCDPAAAALPFADRPNRLQKPQAETQCTAAGHYGPGQVTDGSIGTEDLAVSGSLWWSESNWRNRISFPLTFAPPSNVCDLTGTAKPTFFYGSQAMVQATQQWAPAFCLDPKRFRFQHVQFSEPGSRNLLASGGVEAALVAGPPDAPYDKPVVQAPAAVTGFGIAFSIDNNFGQPDTVLNLDARLLAKLMTMSYPGSADTKKEYSALSSNPTDIISDPEFRALNPGQMTAERGFDSTPASTLFSISSDSDVMRALTSYINADPEARAWLDGQPDPWGMVVNPSYKSISLPVVSWPQLDTFVPAWLKNVNPCYADNATALLPLVAAPVANPAQVTINMQYDIANSQLNCKDAGQPNQRLTSLGRLNPGRRTLLGVVPLADAARYALRTANLQTWSDGAPSGKFDSDTGRFFAGADSAGLTAAAKLLTMDKTAGTWTVPYATLRSAAGKAAYPGIMVMSFNVPTKGLPATDASRYAQLVRFAATTGQTPGSANGQLPGGYLPMTTANGLGALSSYALRAADAIQAQNGYVPAVDGSGSSPSLTPTPTPAATTTIPVSNGSGGSGSSQGGGGSTGTSSEPSPTTAASSPAPSASPSPTDVKVALVARTSAVEPGPVGAAIPAMLIIALVAGGVALVLSLWRRA